MAGSVLASICFSVQATFHAAIKLVELRGKLMAVALVPVQCGDYRFR